MDGRKMRKGPRVRYPDGDGIESMPMKRAGIYQVLNTATGAGYVGSAMDVRFRCQMHRGSIHRGNHDNRLIRRDAREHGPGVFRFKVMEIVEDRYGNGSILITSQLPVDAWHEVIGEPTFADAILDRLVHNAYRLDLDGPSMRTKTGPDAASEIDAQARG